MSAVQDWQSASLEAVAQVVNGGTPRSDVDEYWDGDVQWLTPKDMGQMRSREIASTPRTITQAGLRNSSARLVPANSIILSTRAPIGHLAINTKPMAFNQGCRGIVPGDRLDHQFLYYFLSACKRQLDDLGTGATFKELSAGALRSFDVPLPPLDEQKRIVAVLDQAFAALDRARANAEANLADGEALFERVLLTTFDELMPTASMKTLAEAAKDFSRGKSKHRPRNDPALYGGEYPFIQTGDVRKAQGSIREFSQTYNAVGLAQSKLWPVGTVCITIAANIAETGVLEVEACFPDSVIGMVPRPGEVTPYYVEYMLRYFSRELKLKGKGSAQDNINLATFEAAEFPFPPLEQQQTIVEKLDGLATQLATLRANYTRAVSDITTLRRSLLQVAFSGQLG